MPRAGRKRKRDEKNKNGNDAPLPASLIPAKKKAKKGKTKVPPKGKKRKGTQDFEPETKKAKKTKSRVSIQSGNSVNPDGFQKGFVDPLIFQEPNEPITKTSKKQGRTMPASKPPGIPSSSVPPTVGFKVTPKATRSPVRRVVTPFPRKENILIASPKEETKRGSFRRVTKEDIRRESVADGEADVNEPVGENLTTRVKSACATCWKLIGVIILAALIYPLFFLDSPLSSTQAFLGSRMEKFLLNELQKQKGSVECSGGWFGDSSYGLSKPQAMRLAKSYFGQRFEEEHLSNAIDEVIKNKGNQIEYNGSLLTTTAEPIKSKECLKDEEVIKRIHTSTAEHLRSLEGIEQCRLHHFEERNTDDRIVFPTHVIRQKVFEASFKHMALHKYEALFDKMVEKARSSRVEGDIAVKGADIYTTLDPRYSFTCQIELWITANLIYIAAVVAVLVCILYVFYKYQRNTAISEEAQTVYKDVIEQLENRSRLVATWVPIKYVKELVFENGDPAVWAEVEKKVASSARINKGIEMVDGFEQKCWKMKLHHS